MAAQGQSERRFVKMHGLGNDFVVLDGRQRPLALTPAEVRAIADRTKGVGCDQLITLEPSAKADVFMRIHNADGGEVEACGNAARCVAWTVMRERGVSHVSIDTAAGTVAAEAAGPGLVKVDMGEPRFGWRDIPLAREADTLRLDYRQGPLHDPVAVNVGNPHVVFFVANVATIEMATWGPLIEHDPLFPRRINVGVAEVKARDRLRLRVWERGAGLTLACGTGACAALVAAVKRGHCDRKALVEVDGGMLDIEWAANNRLYLTGPVAETFTGALSPGLLRDAKP
jgi:diaminopimelate epimerase